jgi:putative ABC transport system substrate-binding protein
VALLTPCALAAQKATSEIPIVVVSGDPLGTGLVKSLTHPGANVTGISLMGAEMHGKCVELFRDIFPSLRRVSFGASDVRFRGSADIRLDSPNVCKRPKADIVRMR